MLAVVIGHVKRIDVVKRWTSRLVPFRPLFPCVLLFADAIYYKIFMEEI